MYTLYLSIPCKPSYLFQTNSDSLAHLLCLKYGAYITSNPIPSAHLISALKDNMPQNNCEKSFSSNVYHITYETNCITTSSPLLAIEDILYEQSDYPPGITAFHGAAIEYNSRAYLFLAATTSGKTTLTSFLTTNGFNYITDDCILLDQNTFTIYPYTTPLHLRNGGLSVLKEYGTLPKSLEFLDAPCYERYVYTPTSCISAPVPLGRIFFITRTERENCLVEMSTTERMTALLKSPIKDAPLNSSYLQFIARLAKYPCHKLYYSDMNYVMEVLQNG